MAAKSVATRQVVTITFTSQDSTMSQPDWKLVANLGDANPFLHGGFFVYEDQTGVYPPEAELLEVDDEDALALSWTAYRIVLEPCTLTDGVLSDNSFHPTHPAWFADELPGIASATGQTVESLQEAFCSPDSRVRAFAYRAVGEVVSCGFLNFDESPLKITSRREVKARYKGYDTVR